MKLKSVFLLHGASVQFPESGRIGAFDNTEFDITLENGVVTVKRTRDSVTRSTCQSNCWWEPMPEADKKR